MVKVVLYLDKELKEYIKKYLKELENIVKDKNENIEVCFSTPKDRQFFKELDGKIKRKWR